MILKNRGAEIFSGAQVTKIANDSGKASVTFASGSEEKTVTADKVLIATGRKSVLDAADKVADRLETVRGRIVTDKNGKTSIDHIYAAGDIAEGIQLAHKASAEGENIAMYGRNSRVRLLLA